MSKITLTDVVNLENQTTAVNAINSNNAILETALENTLSRDGTQPNTMSSILDMNSHQILNLPAPGGLNSPLRLTDLNTFIGGGSIAVTNIPAGGAKNSVLKKNSAADYDSSWAYDTGYQYNPYNYGAIGDGVVDDSTAITNCITAARTAGKTMVLTDGIYKHSASLNWAWNNFEVYAAGANVVFRHSGSGTGHSFDGMVNYPGSQGCSGGVFGSGNRIYLEGNASTVNLVRVDNWHFSYMRIAGKDASNAIVNLADTGVVGASAVETTFDIKISTNYSGAFTTIPLYGVTMYRAASCIWETLIIESVGNVASATPGLAMDTCIGNVFNAGTVESCLAGGVSINSTCFRNTFLNLHVETNGTQQDWINVGHNNTFIGCAGGGTTSGQYLGGDNNSYTNCFFWSTAIPVGATNNVFDRCGFSVAFSDLGTDTTIISPRNTAPAAAIGQDYTTSVFAHKTINTSNDITLKVNSKSVTDLSGTGSILPTTVSPTLTSPVVSGGSTTAAALGYSAGVLGWGDGAAFHSAVSTDQVQTLTNKTINGASNTLSVRIANDVTGLGTGVATFLATPSSANFAAALTNEDGTGVVPFEATGTWTPIDSSGAGLVFTSVNARYTKIGNIVYAYGTLTFPTTANATAALIGGLPFTVANATYAAVASPMKNSAGLASIVAVPVANSTTFNIWNNTTAANATNTALQNGVYAFNITYAVT